MEPLITYPNSSYGESSPPRMSLSSAHVQEARSLVEQAEQLVAYKAAMVLLRYIQPGLAVLGIAGNTLSLVVLTKPHNRRVPCCVYTAALAVIDNIVLALPVAMTIFDKLSTPILTHSFCGMVVFLGRSSNLIGVLLVVSFTVDRFLCVKFPLKSLTWCSVERAKFTILGVWASSFIFCSPHIMYAVAVRNGKGCQALGRVTHISRIYSWFNIAVGSLIPFAVLLVLNTLIIGTMRKRETFIKTSTHQERPSSGTESTKADGNRSQERQLTIMLLAVSFTLLGLNLPIAVRYIVFSLIPRPTSALGFAYYNFTIQMTRALSFANSACNFLLYCLTGSKFRQDFLSLCSGENPRSISSQKKSTMIEDASTGKGNKH